MSERRLELDARLQCPQCGGVPYLVYRRQHAQADGTLLPSFEHILWPTHPALHPPAQPERMLCPACRTELRRVAP